MNHRRLILSVVWILLLLASVPRPALAYVGPGTGLSAVGVFLAVVMGIIAALFGFLWYPLKRLFRAMKKRTTDTKDEPTS